MKYLIRMAAITGLAISGAAFLAGCEVYDDDPYATGPVVYDPLYDGGYYQGDFWIWHDRSGHYYHERRDEHERRDAVYHPERHGRFESHGDDHRAMEHAGPEHEGHRR